MQIRLSKISLLVLEVVGIAIALAAAFSAFIIWRLQSSPVSLAIFARSAEFAIERSMPPGIDATVQSTLLQKNNDQGGYDLILSDVLMVNGAGAEVAHLGSVRANIAPRDLLSGKFGPREIIVIDPNLRFVRKQDTSISIDYGAASAPRNNDVFRSFSGGKYFRDAFRRAELRDLHIEFYDEASGRSWLAEHANGELVRDNNDYSANIDGEFSIGKERATLSLNASYDGAADMIDAKLNVVEAPVGDIMEMLFGERVRILSAPITGAAAVRLSGDGQIVSSTIKARAGAGVLAIGARETTINSLELIVDFDPRKDQFDIHQLTYDAHFGRGDITGAVRTITPQSGRTPDAVHFDLVSARSILAIPSHLAAPIEVANAMAKGRYEIKSGSFTLEQLEASLLDVRLEASASIAMAQQLSTQQITSPGILADLKIDGVLDPKKLLRAWPVSLALGARDFIEERMIDAELSDIVLKMDLPLGAFSELGRLPDDAMSVTFNVANASAIYAPGMTPLTHASGKGELKGNSFKILAQKGRIGDIVVTSGEVDMPVLSPKGGLAYFRFTAKGGAQNILTVLNQKPLNLLKSTNWTPAQFSGDGEMQIEVTRPNRRYVPRERYGYSGTAQFENLAIENFYQDISLSDASGTLALKTENMEIAAEAILGGTPIKLDWKQEFYGVKDRTEIKVSGVANAAMGDVFGVRSRQLLRGPVAFEATAFGNIGAFNRAIVAADFSKSAITLEAFDWHKPQNISATGELLIKFDVDGSLHSEISLDGEGLEVRGQASFGPTGRIGAATIDRFYLRDAIDLNMQATRTEAGALNLTVKGSFLNAGPYLENYFSATQDPSEKQIEWGEGVRLTSRIDVMALREGQRLRDVSVDFRRGDHALQMFDFSSLTEGGQPVTLDLKATGDETGPAQILEARTGDIGSFLTGVFGLKSVLGGRGVVEFSIPSNETPNAGVHGTFEASDLRVVGAPLLARIFSAGSLIGLTDLLSGEGIELSSAFADFTIRGGVLNIHDAHAVGPAVGLSAEGIINGDDKGGISLNGAIAPAYTVNSLLGATPIVGDLFVNREGEGVVALSYKVSGSINDQIVSVNPLSALAPGLLRRFFEPGVFDQGQDVELAPVEEDKPEVDQSEERISE